MKPFLVLKDLVYNCNLLSRMCRQAVRDRYRKRT